MKQFTIPKSIQLHGQLIKIEESDILTSEEDALGQADYRRQVIVMQKLLTGVPITSQRQAQVFWHEVVHFILFHMEHKLKTDEAFVNLFGNLLHQAVTSMDYGEDESE